MGLYFGRDKRTVPVTSPCDILGQGFAVLGWPGAAINALLGGVANAAGNIVYQMIKNRNTQNKIIWTNVVISFGTGAAAGLTSYLLSTFLNKECVERETARMLEALGEYREGGGFTLEQWVDTYNRIIDAEILAYDTVYAIAIGYSAIAQVAGGFVLEEFGVKGTQYYTEY